MAELAYIAAPAGRVPCLILDRIYLHSRVFGMKVKVTATRGAFRRGEIHTITAEGIIPR